MIGATRHIEPAVPSVHVPCMASERHSGQSARRAAAFQLPHRRCVALTQAIDRERPPCAMCPATPLSCLLVRMTAAGHLSPSRRVRAARPWRRSRSWIWRELASSSRAPATRFATLGAAAREKPDGLSGRLPLCATWIEFRNSDRQIYAHERGDYGRAVS